MQARELDREEQWIAKYRAAFEASLNEPSVFHQVTLTWENVFKFTTSLPLKFCHLVRPIDRIRSIKTWLTSRSSQILRPKNGLRRAARAGISAVQ
jgi:hypothetical protein